MRFSASRSKKNPSRLRSLQQESLESRLPLTVEGAAFDLSREIDPGNLSGTLTASIEWGDGSTSAGVVTEATSGNLVARIDYSLDTNNFFDTQAKRDLLQKAADEIFSRFGDDLEAISPGPSGFSFNNSWDASFNHPGTGAVHEVENLQVAANEIVVYAGGRELGGNTLGIGGPGGFGASGTNAFLQTVQTRGESNVSGANATDFGPWGGAITFDVTTNWHFGETTVGLDSNESDFYSVALHELAHLAGVGTSASWNADLVGGFHTGANSVAEFDGAGNPPVSADGGHWASGVTDNGQEAALGPSITNGARKEMTALDFAGLEDLGWVLLQPQVTVTGSHNYPDNATYDGTLTLSGSSGTPVTANFQETITNAAPVLTVVGDQAATVGQALSLTDLGAFTDAGFDNPSGSPATMESFTFTVDWGDGSSVDSGSATIDTTGSAGTATAGSFDGSHTYAAAGSYTVTVTVQDDDGGSDSETFTATVSAPATLTLALNNASIAENAGAAASSGVITRGGDLSQALVVTLDNNDTSEAATPATVTIPAAQPSATFSIDAVNDGLLDGDQTVTLTASAAGYTSDSQNLTVTDHEALTLSLTKTVLRESDGANAATATVTRGGADNSQALTVTITNDDSSEISVPASVEIPAGSDSAVFVLEALDDMTDDDAQSFNLTVSATGFLSAVKQITVQESSGWHNAAIPEDVNNDGAVTPSDALVLINILNDTGAETLPAEGPGADDPSLDVTNDGQLTPVDLLVVINFLNDPNA